MKTLPMDHVRYMISGGDALPDKIRMYVELLYGRKLCNGYGLSETSPFIAVDFDDTVSPTHTVGKPLAQIQCQIRDGDPIGTLWIKGPNIMLGYYNAPQATQQILQDGWLDTGDLARIDAFGKIVICGRAKDIIVNKGIKIYPQEIETLLMSHPLVTMVAVIGVGEHDADQYPLAYVVLKESTKNALDVLYQFCQQNLASYKIPRQFIIVDELPLTATGKINKKLLKEQYGK